MAKTTKSKVSQSKTKPIPKSPKKVSKITPIEAAPKRSKSIIYALIVILLIVGAYLFKELIVAATVNGKPIWRFQIVNQLEKQYGKAVFEDLVVRSLIHEEAAKNNIVVDETEIDARIAELTKSFGGDEEILKQQLVQANLTMEDLRSNYRLELILQKLIPQEEISDEEALKYFEENKDIFGDDAEFVELKDSIKTQMVQETYNQTLQDYVSNLRESSSVKTYKVY